MVSAVLATFGSREAAITGIFSPAVCYAVGAGPTRPPIRGETSTVPTTAPVLSSVRCVDEMSSN